jgi:hypothetical protein
VNLIQQPPRQPAQRFQPVFGHSGQHQRLA